MFRSWSFFLVVSSLLPSPLDGFGITPQCTTTPFPQAKMTAAHDNNIEPGENTAVQDQNSCIIQKQWDVDLYQNKHSFVWEYGAPLVDLLDPQPGERILDVGCGSGELTKVISERGANVVGLDADPHMIEKASMSFPGIDFRCADASKLENEQLSRSIVDEVRLVIEPLFDAIFSNAALHWVTDAEGAVAGMARWLKPGGRFVVEFGGRGNVQTIVGASLKVLHEKNIDVSASSPWYFPSIGEYTSLLEAYGIEVTSATLCDRPTLLEDGESGMRHWLEMFGDGLFRGLEPEEKPRVIDAVVDDLQKKSDLYDRTRNQWTADYQRIRIVGQKAQPRRRRSRKPS